MGPDSKAHSGLMSGRGLELKGDRKGRGQEGGEGEEGVAKESRVVGWWEWA